MATDQPPDPTPDDLLRRLSKRPKTDSRYKLEGEVARGGMGSIIKIWDEDLRRHLAMKVVLGKAEGTDTGTTPSVDSKQLARFLEEAQVTGQLDHPGIVPVHEVGLDSDGRVYFTMKLVKGRDLKHIFDLVFEGKEDWSETRALLVIQKVCEAMAYAHAKGVIHRDLKPANVMVGSFGEVYVMDWGLSRVLGRNDKHDIRIQPEFTSSIKSVKTERRDAREDTPDSPIVTMDGDVMGTPAFMSPEQARGEIEKLGPHSDVYSIGAMLYHLLARQMPYVPPGEKITNRTVLARVLDGPPKPITSLRKDVPAELAAICERAMARDASARYRDTIELAADLRAYLEQRVVSAYETGTWAETRKWVRRNRAASLLGTIAIASLIVGLVLTLAYKDRAQQQAVVAQANERKAQEQEQLANDRANALMALQSLKSLRTEAETLWPARPRMLKRLKSWVEEARFLVEGGNANQVRYPGTFPGLQEYVIAVERLRQHASPESEDAIEAGRKKSDRYMEWKRGMDKLKWMDRMLLDEPWLPETSEESEVTRQYTPSDVPSLRVNVARLVGTGPGTPIYGTELHTVALARRLLELAPTTERASCRVLLAWAFLRSGQLDDALAEAAVALSESTPQERPEIAGAVAAITRSCGEWRSAGRWERRGERDALAASNSALEQQMTIRRSFEFDRPGDQWWHHTLTELVVGLRQLTNETSGLCSSGVSRESGWGILRRIQFAETIVEASISGAEVKSRWDRAIVAIADSPIYKAVRISPQIGLVPIGEDPTSHLWEFTDLQTGVVAQRDLSGKLVMAPENGVVFVLLPGIEIPSTGSGEPIETGSDPSGMRLESRPRYRRVILPFFISKYEMTQAQWQRFCGHNPSTIHTGTYVGGWVRGGKQDTLLHPVESTRFTLSRILKRLDFRMPTAEEWVFAAQSGADVRWWSEDNRETIERSSNLCDQFMAKNWTPNLPCDVVTDDYERFDDGSLLHNAVGSYAGNAFGLYDMIGNVAEPCSLDRDQSASVRDSLKASSESDAITLSWRSVINMGGSFRTTIRSLRQPDYDGSCWVGVRPVRDLDPGER